MAKSAKAEPEVDRQASNEVWSPAKLQEAVLSGTVEQKMATMRLAGILDEQNRLIKPKREKGWLTRAGNYRPK